MVSKPCIWLTAVALLFAGVSNVHAHIHYCFDGQAEPAAVHLVGGNDHEHAFGAHDHDHDHDAQDPHDDHDGDTSHDDLDLDVPNPALAKVVKHELPAIAPALSWVVPFDPAPATALAETTDHPPAPDPPHALPQPRGPPRQHPTLS